MRVRYQPPTAYVEFILPLMHTNWMGTIGGTGLKLFPDALLNLYRVVLLEDTFARRGGGVSLPLMGWRTNLRRTRRAWTGKVRGPLDGHGWGGRR